MIHVERGSDPIGLARHDWRGSMSALRVVAFMVPGKWKSSGVFNMVTWLELRSCFHLEELKQGVVVADSGGQGCQ